MISGNKLIVQVGKESNYPTSQSYSIPTMTSQIRVLSESLNDAYNKTAEGVLTGGKGKSKSVVTSNQVNGNVDFLGRPDDIGLWLKCLLGTETVTETTAGNYKHVFKTAADSLPNMAILLDKVVNTFVYEGVKVGSVDFSAQPEDFLKVTANVQAYKCEGHKSANKATLTPSALNAFMFSGAKVLLASSKIADVTNIKISINNNLQSEITTDTDIHYTESTPGTREITSDVSCIYTEASDGINENYYQNNAEVGLEIDFVSNQKIGETTEYYSLVFNIPANTVTSCSVPFDGADGRHQSMTLEAFENGTDELITVTLINDREDEY